MEYTVLAALFGGLMVCLTLIAIFKPAPNQPKAKEPKDLAKNARQLSGKNRQLKNENAALRKELDRLKKDFYTKPRTTTESEGKMVKGKP